MYFAIASEAYPRRPADERVVMRGGWDCFKAHSEA